MKKEHTQFAGTVPENYEQYLGPLFFEPYALEIVQRIDTVKAKTVLEIACGTGRVTHHLIQQLAPDAILIATDLNAGMIAIAKQYLEYPNLQFKEADAQQLPFDDNSFDLVVCQFGFMFVPDKQQAFNEAYRVLKSGGKLLFATWDRIEHNTLTLTVRDVVAKYFNTEAAKFYNVPHAFYDQQIITLLLEQARFNNIHIENVSKEGTHVTAIEAAKGLILGTPAFNIISSHNTAEPDQLVDIAGEALATIFGNGIITTELNALLCEAAKQ